MAGAEFDDEVGGGKGTVRRDPTAGEDVGVE